VFETDRGLGVQACDECNANAKKLGLPIIHEQDVSELDEARKLMARGETGDSRNRPRRPRRNPAGLTAKGERMYEHVQQGYGRDARAKEIAARTVLARAHDVHGLTIKPLPFATRPSARTSASRSRRR
jgi:hypothetical protein